MANLYPKTISYNHEIEDNVFFMRDNKAMEGKVVGLIAYINLNKGIKETKIEYAIAYKTHQSSDHLTNIKITSDLVFESKSKLLDSL